MFQESQVSDERRVKWEEVCTSNKNDYFSNVAFDQLRMAIGYISETVYSSVSGKKYKMVTKKSGCYIENPRITAN